MQTSELSAISLSVVARPRALGRASNAAHQPFPARAVVSSISRQRAERRGIALDLIFTLKIASRDHYGRAVISDCAAQDHLVADLREVAEIFIGDSSPPLLTC